MADGFSSTLANAVLNVLNGTTIATNAFTTSGNVFVQIHTADPGTAGTTSISAGSSTRQSVTFGTASSGSVAISGTPQWTNGGTSETITDISIWSASTAGTFLCSGTLTASQAWASGNILQLSSLSVSIPTAS
jgi:hypothetical protein